MDTSVTMCDEPLKVISDTSVTMCDEPLKVISSVKFL